MRRYQLKRYGIKTLKGKLCPKIVEKLKAVSEEATDCLSRYADDSMFEVEKGRRTYVMDLRKRTSGCRKWEMTRVSCAHGYSAITFHGHKPKDYVDHYYSIKMFKKAYAPMIYPVPSEEKWIWINHGVLELPKSRVALGRPRKARTRSPDESREPKNPYRMRKFGVKGKCSFCKLFGHNTKTCPKKKYLASNYRQPATEVELPIPSPASTQSVGSSSSRREDTKLATSSRRGGAQPHNKKFL
ncbi:uncharacterized protein LOC133872274 [Alnus glutinosa]|uniref:uncharacterized protein LOC133872274 n=1 Tax=Alnus glutinosa TaxID=3517 RepID=UPI002D79ABFB|nr:uncharacterized protein LOC133872274 [Alnus glutinosa]XP_062165735.1 uncharacterized protein LOC133872274 [Alnus glutinosa]